MKKTKTSVIDKVFDIEPSEFNEIIEYKDLGNLPSVSILYDDYDNKDQEIENQFQDIYDKALTAFDEQIEASLDVEGKYLARNSEVANQLLNTALSAAKEKSNLKKHSDVMKTRKKLGAAGEGGTTNVQNNFSLDRNELLKMMRGEE